MRTLVSLLLITLSCAAQNIGTLYVSQAFVNVGEQAWTTNSGGGGEAPWSPTNISGLRIWLDGNDIVEGADTTVAIWPSRAGWDTIYASNATASGRAKYTTFNSTTNKCSAWYGTNELYVYGANAISSNIPSSTLCFVIDNDGTDYGSVWFSSVGWSSSASRHLVMLTGSSYLSLKGRTLDEDSEQSSIGTTAFSNPMILSVDYLHTSALLKAYSGTTNVQTKDPFQTANNTSATSSGGVRLGYNTPGTFRFVGKIAEVLIYVPAISASERTNLVNYLKTKYNL